MDIARFSFQHQYYNMWKTNNNMYWSANIHDVGLSHLPCVILPYLVKRLLFHDSAGPQVTTQFYDPSVFRWPRKIMMKVVHKEQICSCICVDVVCVPWLMNSTVSTHVTALFSYLFTKYVMNTDLYTKRETRGGGG